MLTNGRRRYTLCRCGCGEETGFYSNLPAGSKLAPTHQGVITGHKMPPRGLIGPDEIAAKRRADALLTAAAAVGLIRRRLA